MYTETSKTQQAHASDLSFVIFDERDAEAMIHTYAPDLIPDEGFETKLKVESSQYRIVRNADRITVLSAGGVLRSGFDAVIDVFASKRAPSKRYAQALRLADDARSI